MHMESSKPPSPASGGKAAGRKRRSKKNGSTAETWLDLFDTAQMDHVTEVARINISDVACGVPSVMHVPIRRWLIAPLEAYLAAHWAAGVSYVNVSAAERFRDVAERLSEHFEDRYPFGVDDAKVGLQLLVVTF